MIDNLFFYISDSTDPYQNLAIETCLLDTVDEKSLILYLWQNKDTVVIGRNQNPWVECRCELFESEGINLARRMSGGGAVFHDLGNLNFTFLYSQENYDLKSQLSVIKKACSIAQIETEFSGRNDILADQKKFSGNAFYSSKGKAYHHGTILISSDMQKLSRYLTPSKLKLEAKGMKSVKSRTINLNELSPDLTPQKMKEYMLSAFESIYQKPINPITNIDKEKVLALKSQYSEWEYNFGKTIPFTFSNKKRFDFGEVDLQLKISNGIIESVKLYTDSMDWQLSELAENALINCKFDLNDMEKALKNNLSSDLLYSIISLLEK